MVLVVAQLVKWRSPECSECVSSDRSINELKLQQPAYSNCYLGSSPVKALWESSKKRAKGLKKAH